MAWIDVPLPDVALSQESRCIARDPGWPRYLLERGSQGHLRVRVQYSAVSEWLGGRTSASLPDDGLWYLASRKREGKQVTPKGVFHPEHAVVDPVPSGSNLDQLVADELMEGSRLGSYFAGGMQVRYDDVEWDAEVYLASLGQNPESMVVNEIRFRVHWGEIWGQREITRAIIEAIERMRADAVG